MFYIGDKRAAQHPSNKEIRLFYFEIVFLINQRRKPAILDLTGSSTHRRFFLGEIPSSFWVATKLRTFRERNSREISVKKYQKKIKNMSKLSETMLISVGKNFKFFSFHCCSVLRKGFDINLTICLKFYIINAFFLSNCKVVMMCMITINKKKTKESNDTGALVCLLLATSMDVLSTVF